MWVDTVDSFHYYPVRRYHPHNRLYLLNNKKIFKANISRTYILDVGFLPLRLTAGKTHFPFGSIFVV